MHCDNPYLLNSDEHLRIGDSISLLVIRGRVQVGVNILQSKMLASYEVVILLNKILLFFDLLFLCCPNGGSKAKFQACILEDSQR